MSMLGFGPWAAAKCPVVPKEQDWIERSLDFLVAQFGRRILLGEVLTPTDRHFPGAYAGSTHDIEMLVDRLCTHMEVDRSSIELEHESDGTDPRLAGAVPLHTAWSGAAGHYRVHNGRAVIAIRSELAERPMALIATVAHELGHARLLGEGRADPDAPDHEPLTDLLTVVFGLGIFSANASFDRHRQVRGEFTYTSTSRLGYLTEPMYGYALARYAWLRNEPSPDWARHLDTNPRAALKQGLRYLRPAGPRR
ncbi:hypothetical protein Dvina_16460 [Dactylosporangium vinaceum]|uniref:Peptidase M48 domain-containing protein n=1 Tax=Dactylosporangium vinaceum TaxID=53362 RepID=A0ABV5M913_9ACTN|nr:hypothetical protein [Dactylosporangium vinaceum]UAB99516.1 hypothetical protein Dvina_16460 [Dactylosporangium vinaceum]